VHRSPGVLDVVRRLILVGTGVHGEQGEFLRQLAERRPVLRRPVEVVGNRQLLGHPCPDRLAELGAVQEGLTASLSAVRPVRLASRRTAARSRAADSSALAVA
jgi:hypothetical protein